MADNDPPASAKPRRELSPVDAATPAAVTGLTQESASGPPAHALNAPAETDRPSDPAEAQGSVPSEDPVETRPARPSRPPVITKQAAVIEGTRPGRIQWASERSWAFAVLLGLLAFITAWISHRTAVDGMLAQLPPGDSGEEGRQAAQILHYVALGLTGLGLLIEALLLAFLRRRGVATRVLLTLMAVASVGLLPLALEILGQGNWLAVVVKIGLIAHAVGAAVGSVLMWLPIGARKSV